MYTTGSPIHSSDEEAKRLLCDECGYSPCVCKNKGQDDVPNKLQRSYARIHIDLVDDEDNPSIWQTPAGKRPISLAQELVEEDEGAEVNEEDEIIEHERKFKRAFTDALKCDEDYNSIHPDLAQYFSEFALSEQQQIAMCRTYANYLAQRLRSKLPEHLRKVKKVTVRGSK